MAGESWYRDGGKDADDGDNHHELNQSKSFIVTLFSVPYHITSCGENQARYLPSYEAQGMTY
jgi:hypothetical protein